MKFRTLFLALFFLSVLIPLCNAALDVKIDIKQNYSIGEEVFFEYTFIPFNFEGEVRYAVGVLCDDNPIPMPKVETIILERGTQKMLNYSYGIIGEQHLDSRCSASVQVMYPFNIIFEEKFSITTLPQLDLKIGPDKKIFLKDEQININYSSSVRDLEIQAKLTPPNGKKESINFPYEIVADKIGTYELEVTASKEGYKSITKKEQFAVIEKQAEIMQINDISGLVVERRASDRRDSFLWKLFLFISGFFALFILIVFLIRYLKEKEIFRN